MIENNKVESFGDKKTNDLSMFFLHFISEWIDGHKMFNTE